MYVSMVLPMLHYVCISPITMLHNYVSRHVSPKNSSTSYSVCLTSGEMVMKVKRVLMMWMMTQDKQQQQLLLGSQL